MSTHNSNKEISKLVQLIDTHALEQPNKLAILTETNSITYKELYNLVGHICYHLQKLNLTGKCIAIMLPNAIELVLCYLACFRLGIIPALINYNHQSFDISKILLNVKAKHLIIHQDKISEFNKNGIRLEKIFCVGGASENNILNIPFESLYIGDILDTKIAIPAASDAIIFHTSGSTGIPKGVVHTHKSVYAMLENVNNAVCATKDTKMLIPLPIWHIGGFTHAMSKLMLGASCILLKYNGVDDNLFIALEKHHPDMMIMHIPSFYDLLYHPKFDAKHFKIMRECVAGGDKLPYDLQSKFYAATGIYLRECYGMTEANLLTINREDSLKKCGSIGKPVQGVQLKLIANTGKEAQPNEFGEIYCFATNVFNRYWENPSETDRKFVDGWFRTHDMARRDNEGYYWFAGRSTELIKRGEDIISPLELEELFYNHPAVKMVASTGIFNVKLGQLIKAFVVLKPNQSINEIDLKIFINKQNPSMVPDQIVFVSDLPRGKTGKIDRNLLKKM